MRSNKITWNITSSLLLQIVSIVSAFVIPRFILKSYGSTYNGIINSITQFLSCVTLLRAGIGGVTRAALYKPLAEGDIKRVSAIVKATEKFMRKIAMIFVALLVCFSIVYPFIVNKEFDYFFSFSLVLTLGINTIFQYAFGITYQILLHADQKLYIYNLLQIISTVLNTVLSVVLIMQNVDIRTVKLISAFVFCITPLAMYYYVHHTYNLDVTVTADNTTIKQRWDAFAHQVAAFVTTNTDLMILTMFSTLYQVSIYSVYYMIVNGVRQIIAVASSALEAFFGKLLAKGDESLLKDNFNTYEMIMHVISTIALMCTAILIVPFVMVYTKNVTDTNYNQPLFGYLLCLAIFLSCIRLPYQNVVEAAGHFRETRNGAVVEAFINIGVSVALVGRLGCIGVAIGTIISIGIRTIQYMFYAFKHLLNISIWRGIKRWLVSLISILSVIGIKTFSQWESLCLTIDSFWNWTLYAIVTFGLVTIVTILVNAIFYGKEVKRLFTKVSNRGY